MAGQASLTSQDTGRRFRLGSPTTALALGGLVLVLAVADVPLARLAHQSLNADTGSVPVWVLVPGAVVGLVVAWRKPGNPLGWILLGSAAFGVLSEDASFYTVADYRLPSRGAADGLGGAAGPARLGAGDCAAGADRAAVP